MSQPGDGDGLIGTFSAGAGKAGICTGNLAWLRQLGYIQDYIYVIYPADSEFMFNLTMSGFPVPMEPVDTTTIQDYYILKSVNQYDGNFNITI